MWKRSWYVIVAALWVNAAPAEWFTTDGGQSYCRPTSGTNVMRDPGQCSANAIFCITPIECQTWNRYKSTGMVSCRAVGAPPATCQASFCATSSATRTVTTTPRCPSLRDCALDPNPDLAWEKDLWRWASPNPPYEYYSTRSGTNH